VQNIRITYCTSERKKELAKLHGKATERNGQRYFTVLKINGLGVGERSDFSMGSRLQLRPKMVATLKVGLEHERR